MRVLVLYPRQGSPFDRNWDADRKPTREDVARHFVQVHEDTVSDDLPPHHVGNLFFELMNVWYLDREQTRQTVSGFTQRGETSHTSMSVGDLIVFDNIETGRILFVDRLGFAAVNA